LHVERVEPEDGQVNPEGFWRIRVRKDAELVVVLKWCGMFLGVTGILAAALNKWPLAPILLILNCTVWALVGRAWREPTVWVTNVFAGLVSLVVLLVKLFDRAL